MNALSLVEMWADRGSWHQEDKAMYTGSFRRNRYIEIDFGRFMPYNYTKCKEYGVAEAAITSKGQITIPAEIRRQMNLGPQDRVVFTLLPNGTTIMRAKNRTISALAGSLKSTSKKRVAIKDMKMQ